MKNSFFGLNSFTLLKLNSVKIVRNTGGIEEIGFQKYTKREFWGARVFRCL